MSYFASQQEEVEARAELWHEVTALVHELRALVADHRTRLAEEDRDVFPKYDPKQEAEG
jgi:hypothetical protein